MDRETEKKLTKDLLENGMVSEIFPKYINSNRISEIKFKAIRKNGKNGSAPLTINLLKKDGGNRTMYLPNPVSYQQLVKDMITNSSMFEKVINKIENNSFSHSKILMDDGTLCIPSKGVKSKFAESRRDKMFLSIGMKYSLKYDIEKFYDSIYTHYLPAGLIGWKEALEIYRNSKEKTNEYEYMQVIDQDMRNLCNGETKGIVTGPFTSRIFSELLQSEIDDEIVRKIQNKRFRRYVDDTEIYIATRDEAEKNIQEIKLIFQKYKLSLKMEKTLVKKFPFIDFNSLRELINIRKYKKKLSVGWYTASQDDFFETLDKAEKMMQDGNPGAFKYILKVLNGQKNEYGINDKYNEKDKSFLYLLNYLVKYPQYSKEILCILELHIPYIGESGKILNEALRNFVKDNQDIASLYIIQVMIKNNLNIEKDIINEYIEREEYNEILKSVFVEYLCEKNNNGEHNKILEKEKEKIKGRDGVDFQTENWLIKYCLYYHNIVKDEDCKLNGFYENFKLYKIKDVRFINFQS